MWTRAAGLRRARAPAVAATVAAVLRTGARAAFAQLSGPPENIGRVRPGALYAVTARAELVLASRRQVKVLARSVSAATS